MGSPSWLLLEMGCFPTRSASIPDQLLSISWVKLLASLFGSNDSGPFSLDTGASRRAADHAEEAVVNEPDHVA
jgi:hypothetical protein